MCLRLLGPRVHLLRISALLACLVRRMQCTPQPLTLYGVTKLAVEGIARVYAADYGIASVGLRPYVVYGPGESSGIAAGPSIAIAASRRKEAATIRFSGRVGFVYVDDVAQLLAAATTRPIQGATVLTMTGDTREIVDFKAALVARTGWTTIDIEGPPLRIPSDLTSDPVPLWLGNHPPTSIEDGIEASIAALRGQNGP
ncbi:NAD-dependent epimerase/dehydratase family protein [Rhizobium sullae]|nr:NAD-dependent epimerase/dehydratase family protein [Rhizobium sullae]